MVPSLKHLLLQIHPRNDVIGRGIDQITLGAAKGTGQRTECLDGFLVDGIRSPFRVSLLLLVQSCRCVDLGIETPADTISLDRDCCPLISTKKKK